MVRIYTLYTNKYSKEKNCRCISCVDFFLNSHYEKNNNWDIFSISQLSTAINNNKNEQFDVLKNKDFITKKFLISLILELNWNILEIKILFIFGENLHCKWNCTTTVKSPTDAGNSSIILLFLKYTNELSYSEYVFSLKSL